MFTIEAVVIDAVHALRHPAACVSIKYGHGKRSEKMKPKQIKNRKARDEWVERVGCQSVGGRSVVRKDDRSIGGTARHRSDIPAGGSRKGGDLRM